MSEDKKKPSNSDKKEESYYAAEEYAVNDYAAPADYTVPQGYYNDNGEFVQQDYSADANAASTDYSNYSTDPNQQHYDPNAYYQGYDYSTGTYTDPNAASAASNAYYNNNNYDSHYSQQYSDTTYSKNNAYNNSHNSSYYGDTGNRVALPEAVTAIQSAATSSHHSRYNNSPAAHNPTAGSNAPTIYFPSSSNPNNPIGPIIITKSGYAGPQAPSSPAVAGGSAAAATSGATATSPELETKKGKAKKKTNVRAAGGEVWEDNSLQDWEKDDFRLFAGDLGNEVTEELLYKTFSKYPSLLRTRVVRDTKTMKSKGFGFISFKDPDDFVKAWREMNGKYVGNRPIKLRKSTWKDRNADVRAKKEHDRVGPYSRLR